MSRRRKKREIAKMSDIQRTLARGAILADRSKQAPNNSYCPPKYYEDVAFTCRDCGVEEVWTAKQQQWYYEVAKGSIYAQPVRCRECRRKIAGLSRGASKPATNGRFKTSQFWLRSSVALPL